MATESSPPPISARTGTDLPESRSGKARENPGLSLSAPLCHTGRMDDFLIIGGGIAGLSVGARLSALGRVCLLESEDTLGYHASGRSAALYEPNYGTPAVVALSRASGDFFHRQTGLLTPRGLMVIGAAGEEEAAERDIRALGMEPLGFDEARELVPVLRREAVTRIGYHAKAWDIDTDRLLQLFAREIRANGGQVLTRQRVTGIRRSESGWQVRAGERAFEARRLVNAAGAWADEVARMAGIAPIGITPMRRSMARVAAPEGLDTARWPMLIGAGESWYAKPDAGALLISPADETPVEPHDAWAEDLTLAQGIAAYEACVTAPVTRMLANWAGLRSFAADRVLVIGPDAADASFLWMAGQGGYGFQTAPAASRLLADLAGGRAPALDAATCAALSPARFA